MRLWFSSLLLAGTLFAHDAAAPTVPLPPAAPPVEVTVLVSFEHPPEAHSLRHMQQRIDALLHGSGVSLDLRERESVPPGAQFGQLLVFKMRGYCSMDPMPIGALSDERGPLAMAFSSDGEVLPFGEVECDRVRESLKRVVGQFNGRAYQSVFDTALGMVMAHEIYHMLARSAEHTHSGVTKPGLTAQELLQGNLSLPAIARLAVKQKVAPQP